MASLCIPLPTSGSFQNQWDFALSNFTPDQLFVIGDSSDAPETNVFSKLNATYLSSMDELPDQPLVLMAPKNGFYIQGEIELSEFQHPENAIYIFGSDNYQMSEDIIGSVEIDFKVFIPTDSQHDMYSWSAYVVTMWDRRMKNG